MAASGENRWPQMGRNRWPLTVDGRLALALGLWVPEAPLRTGSQGYSASSSRKDSLGRGREFVEARDAARALAASGGFVRVSPMTLARVLARNGHLNDPVTWEATDLLVELVLDIQRSGCLGDALATRIGRLGEFGWPLDPDDHFGQHVIAALDLGVFDPPGVPRRRLDVDESAGTIATHRDVRQLNPITDAWTNRNAGGSTQDRSTRCEPLS
jgi:hypothetical protein